MIDDHARDSLHRLALRQHGVVHLDQADAVGVTPTDMDDLVRGGRWRRLYFRTYAERTADTSPGGALGNAAIAMAAALSTGGVVIGNLAARLSGVQGLPTLAYADIAVGPGRHQRRAEEPDDLPPLRSHEFGVSAVTTVAHVPVAAPLWNACYLGRTLSRVHALCALDSSLHLGLVDPAELTAQVAAARQLRGTCQLREVAAIADGRAASPLESRVRLACIDDGVPPDDLQVPIQTPSGIVVAYGDLGWRRGRLIGECDGADAHGAPEALYRDRWRQNDLVLDGRTVLRFTWSDALRPVWITQAVRRGLAAVAAP